MFRSGSFRNYNYGTFRKNPTRFGIPFVLLIVAASFGLEKLTRTRYEVHAMKVSEVRGCSNCMYVARIDPILS